MSQEKSATVASTEAKPDSPALGGSADLWTVFFETKEGMFHPVRYGQVGGLKYSHEEIRGAAELYLQRESRWLKSIDEIRPLDKTPNSY